MGSRQGIPDYDEMSPALAAATRKQIEWLQPSPTSATIQSIRFLGVGEQGEDVHSVRQAERRHALAHCARCRRDHLDRMGDARPVKAARLAMRWRAARP